MIGRNFASLFHLNFGSSRHFAGIDDDERKDKSENTLAYEDSAYTVILRTFIYFFHIVTHIGQEWSIILKLFVSKIRKGQIR